MFITFALITLLGALAMLLQKNVIMAGLCKNQTLLGTSAIFSAGLVQDYPRCLSSEGGDRPAVTRRR